MAACWSQRKLVSSWLGVDILGHHKQFAVKGLWTSICLIVHAETRIYMINFTYGAQKSA